MLTFDIGPQVRHLNLMHLSFIMSEYVAVRTLTKMRRCPNTFIAVWHHYAAKGYSIINALSYSVILTSDADILPNWIQHNLPFMCTICCCLYCGACNCFWQLVITKCFVWATWCRCGFRMVSCLGWSSLVHYLHVHASQSYTYFS